MKIGINSVLFGGYDIETAFKYAALCGYDGIEISAINGMSEHLVIDRWKENLEEIKRLSATYELELLSMEQPNTDFRTMEAAMQAAVAIGIPIINCGPGGSSDNPSSIESEIEKLGKLSERAEYYGVTLCVKAHVGTAIYNTPTSLKVLDAINSSAFGLDMDPSHIHRAKENPVNAIKAVVNRIKHVHIRDCKGRGPGPGKPRFQANGRGDIDLVGYIRVLHEHNFSGPINLEVIGAKDYELSECIAIAAETKGHLQASLQSCGSR
ncbi:MAG: Hydroxypyruvate isomerase [Candidatus Moanabacter tarae]|uniref:Hydroxypyruvate isomerase n=1 Tax=Candidatus Moanibacter tarae TaxID=2200854 RepID=A0A2Z4APJ0_9BACT|nr:MAG: Hydroxypyruvate isomerase [Candidatus Moanabacter tarae]|tara:strand:- start:10918 stop:11715 length:798 start_codon:yes stop_codon:yes gene_type:complete